MFITGVSETGNLNLLILVIIGVVDTDDKFIAGDNATSNKFVDGVVVRVCEVTMDAPFHGGLMTHQLVAVSSFGSWVYRCFGFLRGL